MDSSAPEVPLPTPMPTAEVRPTPTPLPEPRSGTLTHHLGDLELGPGEEIASQCVAWTLNNEQALYVQAVTLTNPGASHHSNWFVVPDDMYEGPDGYFRCRDRDFSEIGAAVAGTVIFAQSTQSLAEEQRFRPGAVVKIPPRHKVVAGVHFLNLANRTMTTGLTMSLEVLHPAEVTTLLGPFRYSYYALDIPPESEQRVAIECDMAEAFGGVTDAPFDMKLHYVLPHTHQLGNHFRVEVVGGPEDGRVLHRLDTFNAEANGLKLDPPVDLSEATGLRVICGFKNPRDESVGWGIGDKEMCVMLGLADSNVLMDLQVDVTTDRTATDEGIPLDTGPCSILAVPRNAAQTMPTPEEVAGDLYMPETLPADVDLPVIPPCEDTPQEAAAELPVSMESIRETVFQPTCNYRACHGADSPAAGLDLETDPYSALVGVPPVVASTEMALVEPGDPGASWLYSLISECEPEDERGTVHPHMPRNGPTLIDQALVAKVRDWIASGAPND